MDLRDLFDRARRADPQAGPPPEPVERVLFLATAHGQWTHQHLVTIELVQRDGDGGINHHYIVRLADAAPVEIRARDWAAFRALVIAAGEMSCETPGILGASVDRDAVVAALSRITEAA